MKNLIATRGVLLFFLVVSLVLAACANADKAKEQNLDGLHTDARLIGEFEDDYGILYSITEKTWRQHPGSIYHVEYWDTDDQYLIARNDDLISGNPGKWTRIDWTVLENMAPYKWGYCLTVFDAQSAAAAAAVIPAMRDTPLSGCNGFPFSRMKRVESEDENN